VNYKLLTGDHPVFASVAKEIVSSLLVPPTDEDGLPDDRIAQGEQRLGFAFPLVLRQFYGLLGRHGAINNAHSHILSPDRLYVENDALVFCEENQRAYYWSIALDNLQNEDPPVLQGNADEDRWHHYGDRLSAFLLFAICWQSINVMPVAASAQISNGVLDRLRASLTEVAGDHGSAELSFYHSGLVVCVFGSQNILYVAAKDDAMLEAFAATFDLNLDYL
jgi:hypothetical protein